ncbi:pentatricopeptide repeat-containing protein At2g34400 [Cucurbita moschata]|uniref:Pentatricopeptide repeat-containing protein At2g34400 n=1 Tax=Cucurbita moschata TaxID=3662 RepID=A0A6J1EUW3_CUCMO|nr:pentatricopeptide repeat-containing protein At2g34400 [Cucurbita moschata]
MLRIKSSPHLISRYLNFDKTHSKPNPNRQAFSEKLVTFLQQCVSIKQLKQIHNQMLTNSIHKPNSFLYKVVDLKDFAYASDFFSKILEPTEYAFNVMIRGLSTTWNKSSLALEFYSRMKFLGLKPNKLTYPFLFIACSNLLAVENGRVGHSSVIKRGLDEDGHVSHSLITMYARCGEVGDARKVFDEIPEKDLVSWNSMISGYSKMRHAVEAVGLFRDMMQAGFDPNEMTLVSVLGACGELGDLKLGTWVEEFVVDNRMVLNSYMGSALIHMYGKCGDLVSARRIFDSMKKKDKVTWNAMITGYAQNGMSEEAIKLFQDMRISSTAPDQITLVGTLSACASIGALDLGKQVEIYASERGLRDNIYVSTALVDMYAKCGSLDNAFRVFDVMPQKNEVSWNAMISALAFHGQAQKALALFESMIKEGGAASPNDITFVGVLSACVHAGLVDEGRRFFHMMSSSFGLVPKIEHYSCMVDLLSRAGHLEEAWDFVKKMPEKPDEVILGALLGACQKRKNVEISERVMKLLLELEPSNSGNYVISSRLYANLRRWDDSARMRMLMKQKGVSKTPGCSWIDINSQLHEFHAGDVLHQEWIEIQQILDLLIDDLRREGYIPNTTLL